MKKILCCLCLLFPLAELASAAETEALSARAYNLSMAGGLINNWCERRWESAEYITIYACNYQMAQRYNLEIATQHFGECTVRAGGDIVQIADCMVTTFDEWLVQEGLEQA